MTFSYCERTTKLYIPVQAVEDEIKKLQNQNIQMLKFYIIFSTAHPHSDGWDSKLVVGIKRI